MNFMKVVWETLRSIKTTPWSFLSSFKSSLSKLTRETVNYLMDKITEDQIRNPSR